MQVGGTESFWASWGNVEWFIAGIGAMSAAIATFVWRLSIKVMMLEHMIEKNDRDTERRHEENMHLIRGTQSRIDGLTYRIDRLLGNSTH